MVVMVVMEKRDWEEQVRHQQVCGMGQHGFLVPGTSGNIGTSGSGGGGGGVGSGVELLNNSCGINSQMGGSGGGGGAGGCGGMYGEFGQSGGASIGVLIECPAGECTTEPILSNNIIYSGDGGLGGNGGNGGTGGLGGSGGAGGLKDTSSAGCTYGGGSGGLGGNGGSGGGGGGGVGGISYAIYAVDFTPSLDYQTNNDLVVGLGGLGWSWW